MDQSPCRPAEVCGRLLAALDASEGRRRRRKRDTTPDSLGMAIKRRLLEETVRDDPDPDAYEEWLLERCLGTDGPSGPVRAMAREIFAEWRLAKESSVFRSWLQQGAPSDDASEHQRSELAARQRRSSILESRASPPDTAPHR